MNLPFCIGFTAPFLEETDQNGNGVKGRRLNNGSQYDILNLDQSLLTLDAPHEAPARYSENLRGVIRRCLRYRPEDRIGINDLKEETDFGRELHMGNEDPGYLRIFVNQRMEQYRIGNHYDPTTQEGFREEAVEGAVGQAPREAEGEIEGEAGEEEEVLEEQDEEESEEE